MLSVHDNRMVGIVLEGLENILKVGRKSLMKDEVNPYAILIEEAYGENGYREQVGASYA